MDQIYKDGIILHEQGILSRDGIHFHSPSPFSRENLFCVLWGAEDVCHHPYRVLRNNLNAFMFTRIIEGNLYYEYRGKTFIAPAGSITLQDCKFQNHYWAKERVRLQFIHFTGVITQAYCDMLYEQAGACFSNCPQTGLLFNDILKELKSPAPNDHQLSWLVTDIFRLLSMPEERALNPSVIKAQQYIHTRFDEPLSLDSLCSHVALSPYYFSRLFKRETGQSPHQYLLGTRMRHARKLLAGTRETVDKIAASCGFSSTSHFIRAFKKDAGMTPASFRHYFESGLSEN